MTCKGKFPIELGKTNKKTVYVKKCLSLLCSFVIMKTNNGPFYEKGAKMYGTGFKGGSNYENAARRGTGLFGAGRC